MCQSLLCVKHRSEASFAVDHTILAEVFELFIRDAFQCLCRLHYCDGMHETFQDFARLPWFAP